VLIWYHHSLDAAGELAVAFHPSYEYVWLRPDGFFPA